MRKENSTNSINQKKLEDTCGLTYAMILTKGRWTVNILWRIYNGDTRYGMIRKEVEGISEKMLTQRLRDLEKMGLIVREVKTEYPSQIEYHLSRSGKDFIPVILALCKWGDKVRPYTKTLL
ncbi:winged helix-turn-helix transcriptional regulator [Ulvibacterium sp.]|uniref:winged helix-turn-helix transcriptional regulator n=1 Tax=Ulvibacterium sp. TaxID=2665914 RepID=UPI003CC58B57